MRNENLIWWLDHWSLKMTGILADNTGHRYDHLPVLPGHIKHLALQLFDDVNAGEAMISFTNLQGKLFFPISTDITGCAVDIMAYPEGDLTDYLSCGYLGIWVEPIHRETLRHYPGIITTGGPSDFRMIPKTPDKLRF